ncbi:MBL fold metallo-hydrolase [Actinoplanes sp. NPDC051411]|uniref:MBL fold metallo-hydrolase n=1 Tax=Actinoplanes sp. NPDC051411 TaxID=3155522 RepID=UPI00342FB387
MATVDIVLRGFSVVTSEGNFAPCGVYLVRADDGRTLVYDSAHAGRRMKLLNALERRGIDPDRVDVVVASHGHWDHVQNFDVFKRAELLAHADELAYLAAPDPGDHATPAWTRDLFAGARGVADGEELLPGVRALHLPGHSPGSLGLAVETADGVAVISGDAVASSAAALAGFCPNVFFDAEKADASLKRVVELADVVYPGHDRPFRITGATAEFLTDIRPMTVGVGGLPAEVVTVEARTGLQRLLHGAARQSSTKGNR